MGERVSLTILPLNATVRAEAGAPIQDLLFDFGVEFPCGGHGECRGCLIKDAGGTLPVTPREEALLTPAELAAGLRLGCAARAVRDSVIELEQWRFSFLGAVLADDRAFEFTPREGFGVAVDVGTTTVAAQLVDRTSGRVEGVLTALNPQARHGADIMSRIHVAVLEGRGDELTARIRETAGRLVAQLEERAAGELREVTLAGNTVMHHLFCGVDLEPLSRYPFEPETLAMRSFSPAELGWSLRGNPGVHFLPCVGGFVGSDVLAGILSVRLHEHAGAAALIDLGTNGEVAAGMGGRIVCASTAAGPAFEGANISQGMRSTAGAISKVWIENGGLAFHVIGDVPPRGVCGSGLVDAAAAALDLGWIEPGGRLAEGRDRIPLADGVAVTQRDIRELQLAKGAIAAGLSLVCDWMGIRLEDLSVLYVAGAFGNHINPAAARRIGLVEPPVSAIRPVGNAALHGAKMALFDPAEFEERCRGILSRVRHESLNAHPRFQEIYVEKMSFPDRG